jgi:hypothetical protein
VVTDWARRRRCRHTDLANTPLPPPLAALPCWNFNVTHHGAIVAMACEPACLVGVDVSARGIPQQPKNSTAEKGVGGGGGRAG